MSIPFPFAGGLNGDEFFNGTDLSMEQELEEQEREDGPFPSFDDRDEYDLPDNIWLTGETF